MTRISRRQLLGGGTAAALNLGLGHRFGASSSAEEAATPTTALPNVEPGALADLRQRLTGTLLLPGDADYEPQSRPSNARFRHTRPIAVAQCADDLDVVTCLRWCQENGVPLVGRGGGHNYAGFSTTIGLTIDLSQLNTVIYDPIAGTATIGGGALRASFKTLAGGC